MKSARSRTVRVTSGCGCEERLDVIQRAMAGPMRLSRVEQIMSPILMRVAAILVNGRKTLKRASHDVKIRAAADDVISCDIVQLALLGLSPCR